MPTGDACAAITLPDAVYVEPDYMTRNEKNVEALAALIARVTDFAGMSSDADHPFVLRPVVTPEVARTIAEQLSDRGVSAWR